MKANEDAHAGYAALTLVESILIHLEEVGHIDEEGRDQIYQVAIGAHEQAQREDTYLGHPSIVKLLRTLHNRSDGIQVVGDIGIPKTAEEED